MFYIADLHLHSHYSRATSPNSNLESLYQWARVKGINVVATGDFTHPLWLREIKEKLEPDGNGLFRLKNPPCDPALPGMKVCDTEVRFCLSSEISSIYKCGNKVRKNHNLVYAPDLDTVARINARLSAIGNLTADGRPILGLPSRDLLEIVTQCSEQAYLVPAHAWTPWFSTLGSKGGYDSITECFRDLSELVFAIETGLSSDPSMNWKCSALDRFTLISNSDAHSPQKMGREANLFNTELSYDGLFNSLKTRKGFLGTYEFFPEEGKYHLDGHRKCGVIMEPRDTIRHKGICPVCGEPLTVGVLNRVEALSDRTEPLQPEGAPGYEYLIPLPEILAEIKGAGPDSKSVQQAFHQAISTFGNEFTLLNTVSVEDIRRYADPLLGEAIRRMRSHEVDPQPGYDGVYGVIRIFKEGEIASLSGQFNLFGIPEPVLKKKDMYEDRPAFSGVADIGESFIHLKTEELNEAQEQVKDSVTGAVLVKAGPGTGKTSALIRWIGNQVASGQAQPCEVLAITFTNKAAREITERLTGILCDDARRVVAGTFHAIAWRMLQEHCPALNTVYDETNRLSVIRFLFPELDVSECKKLSASLAFLFELREEHGYDNLSHYASAYRQYLSEQGAVDISDIMGQLLALWKDNPSALEQKRAAIRAIAADEFQDINSLQYEFLTMLGKDKNLLAIGDPDQSIYGFRGSDVHLFFRFADDFHPNTISLALNYRSVPAILDAAGKLISYNILKSGITLQPVRKGKQKIRLYKAEEEAQEARFIAGEIEKKVGGFNLLSGGTAYNDGNYAFSDIAVLYRTHYVGRQLISYLKAANIPVIPGDGTTFLGSEPFTLIVNILKLTINPADKMALEGVMNRLPGWTQADVRTFLTRLHETSRPWTEITPATGSATASEAFTQWKIFFTGLDNRMKTEGLASVANDIFKFYLPDSELNEDQLLKKEYILLLAGEAGTDVRAFISDAMLNNYTDTGREQAHGTHLLTFHAAKGLEFPVVFIAGAEDGITPSNRRDSDPEEERRLFYVAMTRARDELYITCSAKRTIYGREETCRRSRFIDDIPPELTDTILPPSPAKKQDIGNQLSLF